MFIIILLMTAKASFRFLYCPYWMHSNVFLLRHVMLHGFMSRQYITNAYYIFKIPDEGVKLQRFLLRRILIWHSKWSMNSIFLVTMIISFLSTIWYSCLVLTAQVLSAYLVRSFNCINY